MRLTASSMSQMAAGFALGLSLAGASLAETPVEALAATVAQIESQFDSRVGITIVDTGSDFTWSHRDDERFLMNSAVKVPICGAVLARADVGNLALSQKLPVQQSDLVDYAPVAERHVGGDMTIAELCLAAIDQSDNTAANLLIDHLGGPQVVTGYFRDLGDPVSRLDRYEPALNSFAPGDPRDTTTPAAFAESLRRMLLGDALSPASRNQLAEWMRHGGVTGKLLRRDAPAGWRILDKSGSGSHNRNIVAVINPDDAAPWIVTIFLSDMDADFATRDAALQRIGSDVVALIGG